MNDFFAWNMQRVRPFDVRPALTEAQCDELFTLFDEAGLPATAMNAEMADGYIAGCQTSPQPVAVHEWMERIFGQPTLPICADSAQQDRLLELLVQRQWDTMGALSTPRKDLTPDNIYTPLTGEVADEDRIQPYQLDAQGNRLGSWDLKDWAAGFHLAAQDDDEWDILVDDADSAPLLAPFILFQKGYNPDQPDQQVDHNTDLLPLMVSCLYEIKEYWRAYHRAMIAARASIQNPFIRDEPKVGRNDPCPCGSTKKFKKCCGTQ